MYVVRIAPPVPVTVQAYNFSQSYLGKPAISLSDYEGMVRAWPACQAAISNCQTNTNACASAESSCNNAMFGP